MTCRTSNGLCVTSRQSPESCPIHSAGRRGLRSSSPARTPRPPVPPSSSDRIDPAELTAAIRARCEFCDTHQQASTAPCSCSTGGQPAFACRHPDHSGDGLVTILSATDGFQFCGRCPDYVRHGTPEARETVAALGERTPAVSAPPVKRLPAPLKTVIAIICHNYGRFLADCVQSVRALQHETHQVFVVDDASDDETPEVCNRLGVPRHRVEFRSVHRARQHASQLAEQAGAEVIVFLDADDMLPPDYLAGLQLFTDPTIGIVYSDMQRFGLDDRLMEYPAQFDRSRFWIDNCIHAGSLCRISALRQADAFYPLTSVNTHDDWTLWKRLIRYGYTAAKQSARYLYRQHPDSMIRKHKQLTYADRANLTQEPVTVFCPLSGRAELWDRFAAQLESLNWPAEQLSLILFDTSQSDTFAARVRRWMNRSHWSDIRHVRHPVGPPRVADVDRRHPGNRPAVEHVWTAMARIYNWLRRNLATEYAFVLEDDVFVPTADVIGRLMASIQHDVICVSGAYRSPYWGTWIAWDKGRAFDLRFTDKPSDGIQQVGGTGFGCALMRRQMFDLGIFTDRADSFASVSSPDYDRARFTRLEQTHWRTLMDWSIECDHISRADVDGETPQT